MSQSRGLPEQRPGHWLGLTASAGLACVLMVGCHSLNPLARDRVDRRTEPAVAAAPGGPPPLPSEHSFRVAPYVFTSDFPINRDQPLFRELAQLRDHAQRELLLPPSTEEVRVYLFETQERYRRYMQSRYPELPERRAFFIANPSGLGTGGKELVVLTYWGDGERIRQDLRHELTHALLNSVIKDVPIWLDEALAEFFELPPEKRGVNSTHVLRMQAERAAGTYRPDLARLERMKKVDEMTPAEYREAWAWAHLMLNSTPEAKRVLLSYLQQLRGSRHPGPLRPQLAKVFPSPEEALVRHLARLENGEWTAHKEVRRTARGVSAEE
jgi:hypothetical protein